MSPVREATIIFIGGPSTSGKSTLARAIGSSFDARVVDTDLVWVSMQRLLPLDHEIHLFHNPEVWTLPAEELLDRYFRISRVVCLGLEAAVALCASHGFNAVFEGCWVLPEFAAQKTYAGYDAHASIRALFLYEPSLDALAERLVRRESGGQTPLPVGLAGAHTLMQHEFGVAIRGQAEGLNLPVLEPEPFETLLERAREALQLSA